MDFLTGAFFISQVPSRCSTLRWCLKDVTLLLVVSMRRTRPNLSYILIELGPMWCLIRVPSIRVWKSLPTSTVELSSSLRPINVATLSGLTDGIGGSLVGLIGAHHIE